MPRAATAPRDLWHDTRMAELVRVWASGDAIEGELLRARLEAFGRERGLAD